MPDTKTPEFTDKKTVAAAPVAGLGGVRVGVMITSTLVPDASKPLSYTSVRSVYSPLQRLEQTVESVRSVLKRIPGAYVLVTDNSKGLDQSFITALKGAGAEVLHHHGEDADSAYKALGEAHGTLQGLAHLRSLKRPFDYFLKLSGRYWLTDAFDLGRYMAHKDKLAFWRDPTHTVVSTVLYGVPGNMIDLWERCVRNISEGRSGAGYEQQMYQQVHAHAHYVTTLGASGHVSVDGTLWKC